MISEKAKILESHTSKAKKRSKARAEVLKKHTKNEKQKELETQKKTIDDLEDGWDELEDDKEKEALRQGIEFDTSDEPIEGEDAFEEMNSPDIPFEDLESAEESGEIETKKKKKKEKKKKKDKVSVEVSPDYAEEAKWYGFEPNEKDFFKRGEFMEEQNLAEAKAQLEKEPWEAIQSMEPQEVIDTAENIKYRTDRATMELIDNVTGKKGAGEEYAIENNQLILLDNDINYIEKELMTKFDFNVNRAGWLKKFNIKRKLDPENFENFKYLVSTHKKMQKEYKKQIKKHLKKFADTVDLVTPRVAKTKSSIVRMP